MAKIKKLGRRTDQRLAVLRNQASYLLWHGKIETTLEKAKALRSYTEKIITLAVNSFEDTITSSKEVTNDKNAKITKEIVNDGPKKLAARRKIMNKVYDLQELKEKDESRSDYKKRIKDIKHPLIEKIFNVYGAKYLEMSKSGSKGGYTRVIRTGNRKGDNAPMAIIELI